MLTCGVLLWAVGTAGFDGDAGTCERHTERSLKYYCEDCSRNICDLCVEQTGCGKHRRSAVAAVAERLRQGLDTSFTVASTQISGKKTELEGKLRALADEKDRALLKIDSAFETHAHTLARRATLLKNKVIDIYNENAAALESGLEEIDTAMTCVVSLREYYDSSVSRGDYAACGANQGSVEIDEVARNIADRVCPPEVHLVFDGDHGADKFRSCTKDVGRVVCNRSKIRKPDGDACRPVLMSSNSDSNLVSPETSAEFASSIEKCNRADELASGDGSCFASANTMQRDLGNILTSGTTEGLWASGGTGEPEQLTEPGSKLNVVERQMDRSLGLGHSLPTSNEDTVAANMSVSSTKLHHDVENSATGSFSCVLSSLPGQFVAEGNESNVKNNNFCDLQPVTGSNLLNNAVPCRSHVSYDEQHLRHELNAFDLADDVVSVTDRLSQSEFWTLGSDAQVADYSEDHVNVIAELSGEQTSL